MNSDTLSVVKAAEIQWHDEWYSEHASQDFPELAEEFVELFRRVHLTRFCDGAWAYWGDVRAEMMQMIGNVRGLDVLDYGCGAGQLGIYLALQGANVRGFDISSKGIQMANWAATKYGAACQFDVMDAEALQYDDEQFDLVVGFGVLHHVIKYPASAQQLARVLRKNGRAIFHETLWDNPAINFVRRWTTEDEDAGDAHLTNDLINLFGRAFEHTEVRKRHILYMLKRLASLPARGPGSQLAPRPLWKAIKAVDRLLINAGCSRFCGEVLVTYNK